MAHDELGGGKTVTIDTVTKDDLLTMSEYSLRAMAEELLVARKTQLSIVREELRATRAKLKTFTAYPEFCTKPELCAGKGRCMNDWVCND